MRRLLHPTARKRRETEWEMMRLFFRVVVVVEEVVGEGGLNV